MLVEFQEAQCFFMLSIQAAALIALSTGPQVFEATSFAQLESNVSAIALVALMGVVPVTFGLWVLHKVGMNSWYTMFWSTISVALSNVTLYMGNSSPSATSLVTISSTDRLDKCGHYGPPLIYCYGYSGSTMGSYSPSMFILRIINYVSLAFYGIIVLMWLAPYLRRCMQKNEWSQHTYVRVHQVLTARWARAFGRVWTVFVELVSMLFCVVYGIYLTSRNFGAFDADSWSFGQIIAVTIWAPVICKYFYWAMFGTESYSAIRVPEPYKILRVRTSNILETGSRSEDGERLFIHIPSTSDLNLGQSSTQVTDVELTSLKSRTTGMREEPEEKQARWKAREMN
ncbi:hypothetical protein MW887_001955 [Aspergillus wentii]|nr:hypothetical protein MW887_001955 [Aspergillus wentii]